MKSPNLNGLELLQCPPCHRSCTLNFMNMLIALQGEVVSAQGIYLLEWWVCGNYSSQRYRDLDVIVVTSSIVVFNGQHFPIYRHKQEFTIILVANLATATCHIHSITSTMFPHFSRLFTDGFRQF